MFLFFLELNGLFPSTVPSKYGSNFHTRTLKDGAEATNEGDGDGGSSPSRIIPEAQSSRWAFTFFRTIFVFSSSFLPARHRAQSTPDLPRHETIRQRRSKGQLVCGRCRMTAGPKIFSEFLYFSSVMDGE